MPETPFSTLPLSEAPYSSRVSGNYSNKNYYMLAFNPGYALQAAELNETQEIFYLNQSLSVRYGALWRSRGFLAPVFWEGMLPYDPSYVSLTINSATPSSLQGSVTVSKGWYLWTDRTSKLSTWIYSANNYTLNFGTQVNTIEFIGFFIKKNIIKCCQTNNCPPGQDATLRDNFGAEFTCGASRLGLEFNSTPFVMRNDVNASENGYDFYPMMRVGVQSSVTTRQFYDGQGITGSV